MRSFEVELHDKRGTYTARVEVDCGAPFSKEVVRLAKRVRASKTLKSASSAGGVIRVFIVKG